MLSKFQTRFFIAAAVRCGCGRQDGKAPRDIPRSVQGWGAWLAPSVEHETLELRFVSLSPTLSAGFTLH